MANRLIRFLQNIFSKPTQTRPAQQKAKREIQNKHGVSFTHQEKKRLEHLAGKANKIRTHMLKHEHKLVAILGGEVSDKTVGQTYGLMGRESDFILTKKNPSLDRHRTRDEYNRYVEYLEKAVQKEYIYNKVELYKENFIKSIQNVYGTNADKLVKAIKELSHEEYIDLVGAGDLFEISYLDSGNTPNMSDSFADSTLRKMYDVLGIVE